MRSYKNNGKKIAEKLSEMYPDAECTLHYTDGYRLMISGILASQCTDERVNRVTQDLFARFPGIEDLAKASHDDLMECIRSCGFFRVKSAYVKESMQILHEKYASQIPSSREELMQFPGVGRKIANLILGDLFHIPAIVVDTHCSRIAAHLGLTDFTDPLKIEKDLMACIPKEYWISFGHRLVAHGRAVCIARRPRCRQCGLVSLCRKGSGES